MQSTRSRLTRWGTRRGWCARPGAAVAAIVVLLAMVHLVVVGVMRPAGDEMFLAEQRVQSARALHAAESGARIVIKAMLMGDDPPEEGAVTDLGLASFEVIQAPPAGEPGEIVIEGRAGAARRRISILVL